jgi:hypothetical protein
MPSEPDVISANNSQFWNELCGSVTAKSLGVVDNKPASLKRFDNWYLAYYPYLFLHIPFDDMKDRDASRSGWDTAQSHSASPKAEHVTKGSISLRVRSKWSITDYARRISAEQHS